MGLKTVHYAALLLIGAVLCVLLLLPRDEPEEAPVRDAKSHRRDSIEHAVVGSPAEMNRPLGPPPGATRPQPAPDAEVLEILSRAATSYDAAELPTIEPYLRHSSPEVRQAALDSVIILGDAAGAPILRAAAATSETPAEADKLLKAAAFLELPPRTKR
jgi:hypothetical protein